MRSPRKTKQTRHQLHEAISTSLRLMFEQIKDMPDPTGLHQLVVSVAEEPLLRETLIYTQGNFARAARILGISPTTLRNKVAEHKIKVKVPKK